MLDANVPAGDAILSHDARSYHLAVYGGTPLHSCQLGFPIWLTFRRMVRLSSLRPNEFATRVSWKTPKGMENHFFAFRYQSRICSPVQYNTPLNLAMYS
jgi:hypothetical protein